jgi:LCP family protein required for cell wall assembly
MVMGGKRRSSGTGTDPLTVVSRGRRRSRRLARTATVVVAVLVLSAAGYVGFQYEGLAHGIQRSNVLQGLLGSKVVKSSTNGDTNILIMGLDSRLDEKGHLLPRAIYSALHAGDSSAGGENANVLMFLHVPGDGGKAIAISIPRDDYVALPGCPDGQCHGKIKQAYGLALDQAAKKLVHSTWKGTTPLIQQERDAGRRTEIATVSQFLGGAPIDHFVEVTMVGFFQIAQVVQPITVCLKEDTQDSYSGAKFRSGVQHINAAQAVAFVRQRRDNVHPDLNFTDLDRSRRQQAFIASLAYQLKAADTLTDPSKLSGILDVAKQNVAVDSALNLLVFAQQASGLTGGNVTFYTLPIDHFGTDPLGESVNIVNLPLIQSTVRSLLQGGRSAPKTVSPTTRPALTSDVVNVSNATGRTGRASELVKALAREGYHGGAATTHVRLLQRSLVQYAAGETGAASSLAATLGGMPTQQSASVSAGNLDVVIGTDFTMPSALGRGATGPGSPPPTPAPATAVSATGGGRSGPAPTQLSALSGGGVPCVK